MKQKRWQEKHRRFIFGIHHSNDENELGEREPLVHSGSSNEAVYHPPASGNMMSVSDDSEYYKDNKGSMSLMQILEGLPDDKSSRASRGSSKSRILSIESEEESESDSAGSTGRVESYDLAKSREVSREHDDSIPEDEPVVAISIPPLPTDQEMIDEALEPAEDLPIPEPVPDIEIPADIPAADADDETDVDDQNTDTQALLPMAPHATFEEDEDDDQHTTRL